MQRHVDAFDSAHYRSEMKVRDVLKMLIEQHTEAGWIEDDRRLDHALRNSHRESREQLCSLRSRFARMCNNRRNNRRNRATDTRSHRIPHSRLARGWLTDSRTFEQSQLY